MNFGLLVLAVCLYSAAVILTIFVILFILKVALRKNFFIHLKTYISNVLIGTFMYIVYYLFMFVLFYTPLKFIDSINMSLNYFLSFVFFPFILLLRERTFRKAGIALSERIIISSLPIIALFLEPITLARVPILYESAMFPLPFVIWKFFPLLILFFVFYELKVEKVSFAKFGIAVSLVLLIITTFTVPLELTAKPEGSIYVKGIFIPLKTSQTEEGLLKSGRAFPFLPIRTTFKRGEIEKGISFLVTPGNVATIAGTLYIEKQGLKYTKELEIPLKGQYISSFQLFPYDDNHILAMPSGIGNKIFLLNTSEGVIENEIALKQVSEDITWGTIISVDSDRISILHQFEIFNFDLTGNLIGRKALQQIVYQGLVLGFAGYNENIYIIDERNFYSFENGKLVDKFPHKLNLFSLCNPNLMYVRKDGKVFVSARDTVYELQDKQFSEYIKLDNSNTLIKSICFDENDNLYAICMSDLTPTTLTITKIMPNKKVHKLQDLSFIYSEGVIVLSQSSNLLNVYSTSGFIAKNGNIFITSIQGEPSGSIKKVSIQIFEEMKE